MACIIIIRAKLCPSSLPYSCTHACEKPIAQPGSKPCTIWNVKDTCYHDLKIELLTRHCTKCTDYSLCNHPHPAKAPSFLSGGFTTSILTSSISPRISGISCGVIMMY